MSATLAILLGIIGALEVSQEPVAVVVKYPNMQQISLSPDDVMIYSEDIPQVQSETNPKAVYSKRSMTDMIASNVPEPPPESRPTLPNESRTKKRLDHTPPFNGTVTGDISIIESAPDERIILVSNIQGDGVMQILVKGGTAKKASGAPAAAVVESPKVIVRNTRPASKVVVGGTAEPKAASAMSTSQKSSLEKHFKGTLPANLKVVSEAITVK